MTPTETQGVVMGQSIEIRQLKAKNLALERQIQDFERQINALLVTLERVNPDFANQYRGVYRSM
jgi:hypothetical protein